MSFPEKPHRRARESLTTVQKHNTPLAEATTSSLEAFKAYSAGWKIAASKGTGAAIPFFKRAIDLDPKFAGAYAALGLMYGDGGESARAAENTRKAYELRERTSDDEKFFAAAYYDGGARGNLEKAEQTCESWTKLIPVRGFHTTFCQDLLIPHPADMRSGSRNRVWYLRSIRMLYLLMPFAPVITLRWTKWKKPKRPLPWGTARKLESPQFMALRYDIAFLKGDGPGMEREVSLAKAGPGDEARIANHEVFALAYTGHLQQARQMSRTAVEVAEQAAHRERAGIFEAGAALREALFGNAAAAKESAKASLELSKDREAEYGAELALAISGDSSLSSTLAEDLEKRFPEDTWVRFSYCKPR